MKKILLFVSAFLLTCSLAFAATRNIGDNYKVVYGIVNSTGAPVEGQSPTVKIQRVSDGYWFDFSDSTFKASGWSSKTQAMTEDSTDDFYYYTFDPPASETTANQYLLVVDNSNATYMDHQVQIVNYQNLSSFASASDQVIVVTNNDKTGYALSGTQAFNVTGNITGSVSGSVGSVTGGVTVTTNNDKAGYNITAAAIDYIWDEVQSGHTLAGTFGKYLDAQVSTISGGTGLDAAETAAAVWNATMLTYNGTGTMGNKINVLPTSGTGDWTAGEKADILEALSVDDGVANTDLDNITTQIRIHR